MKKFLFLISAICLILSVTACDKASNESNVNESASNNITNAVEEFGGKVTYSTFSYKEDKANYKTNDSGVTDWGFKNTTETEVTDADSAIELAIDEASILYENVDAAYDKEEKMWRITFYSDEFSDEVQMIYINSKGITVLSVYK